MFIFCREYKTMTKVELQANKSAKSYAVILCISEMQGVSLEEAMDIYYTSPYANLIDEGIADLHCRSSKYLAEIIINDN